MKLLKTFHIAPKSVIFAFSEKYLHSVEWHSMPLDVNDPDGLQLVCWLHPDEYIEAEWAALQSVQSLPHPHSGRAIHPDHHKLLTRIGASPTDTVFDIANKAKDFHPCMRLTGFW